MPYCNISAFLGTYERGRNALALQCRLHDSSAEERRRDFSVLWNNARSAVHDAVHEKKLIKNCSERNLQITKGDNKHEIK